MTVTEDLELRVEFLEDRTNLPERTCVAWNQLCESEVMTCDRETQLQFASTDCCYGGENLCNDAYILNADANTTLVEENELINCGELAAACILGERNCTTGNRELYWYGVDCCSSMYFMLHWEYDNYTRACDNTSSEALVDVEWFADSSCLESIYNSTESVSLNQCMYGNVIGDGAFFYRTWQCNETEAEARNSPVVELSYHYGDEGCEMTQVSETFYSETCEKLDDFYNVCPICGSGSEYPPNDMSIAYYMCFDQSGNVPPIEYNNPSECFNRGEDWRWVGVTCSQYQLYLRTVPIKGETCSYIHYAALSGEGFYNMEGLMPMLTPYCCEENTQKYFYSRAPCEYYGHKPPAFGNVAHSVPIYITIRNPRECESAYEKLTGLKLTATIDSSDKHFNEPGACYYVNDTDKAGLHFNHQYIEDMVVSDKQYGYICKDIGDICDTSDFPNKTHECGHCIVGVELPGKEFTCKDYCESIGSRHTCLWGGRSNYGIEDLDDQGCAAINAIELLDEL